MSIQNKIKLRPAFSPFSFLYGVGLLVRNKCYDWNLFRSRSYKEIPIISIGNLAMGGTGKTPHTEFLIRALSKSRKVAVLSRGYKRKSKGYVLANEHSTNRDIGDEPYQIKQKFPSCIVAVDANRNRGIQNLLNLPLTERPEVILLDDAFQHRAVFPTFSILLTKSTQLYIDDRLFPVGNLREPQSGVGRADIIIVTKCSDEIKPIDMRIVERSLHLRPLQHLFFSKIEYDKVEPVFPNEVESVRTIQVDTEVLLVAGIESPDFMVEEVERRTKHVTPVLYPDHYALKKKDYEHVSALWQAMPQDRRMLLVSEKDAARIKDDPALPAEWRKELFYLPIRISFLQDKEDFFLELIEKQINNCLK